MGHRHAVLIGLDPAHLIASLDSGEVVLLKVSEDACHEKARFRALAAETFAHPAIADGRLFIRDNRNLVCFGLYGE